MISNSRKSRLTRDTRISMGLQRELRSKKLGFNMRVSKNDDVETKETIKKALEQHEHLHDQLHKHIRSETRAQEDQFNLKMGQRRERSVNRSLSRSMNKSKSRNDVNVNTTSNLLSALQVGGKTRIDNPFEKDDD